MASKSSFELGFALKYYVCGKRLGKTYEIEQWAKRNYCKSKKCRKQEMLDKLNG